MTEFVFEGRAILKSDTESDLAVKDCHIVTVSPPPQFGGKAGCCTPEDIFTASLASCLNTIYLLIAGNSKLARADSVELRASYLL